MTDEIKGLIEQQGRTFQEFKAANDALQAEVKRLGAADVVAEEKLAKINKALDDVGDQIKIAIKRADEIEAKANRAALGGKGGDDVEVKSAQSFAAMVGQAFTVEQHRDYKQALFGPDGYLRRNRIEAKALAVGSDPSGGYLVTPDTSGRILQKVFETSAMRQYASVTTIGTDTLEGLIDREEASAGWVGEKATRSETATPDLGKWSIPVNEIYAKPRATQKVLDDAMFDVEAWLGTKVADKFARTENAAYVAGDGALKPRGFTTYTVAATADASRAWGTFEYVASGASGAFSSSNPVDAVISLIYALKAAYRRNARFFTNRGVQGAMRKLKDGQGNYLWQPSAVAGQPAVFMGYEVVDFEDMPALGANSLSLAFGDMALTYQIVDRMGIRVLRDPYSTKGFVEFYTTRRTGGDVLEFEAMKFMKFAAS